MEIRRIDNRIGDLEGQLMRTRLKGSLDLTPAADLEAEIVRQEDRLRQLLDAGAREREG
jgi:hypothetical protein